MLAGNVGYVFQNPDDQIFKYNVMDEILFGPLNIGMDAERAKKEAERALRLTGLTGKEKENPLRPAGALWAEDDCHCRCAGHGHR